MVVKEKISPRDVVKIIGRHMLADGYTDIVVDLEKSQGAYIYDSLGERKILDFFSFFCTYPVAYNHPKMRESGFLKKLMQAAIIKPSNSDLYTVEMAEFVEAFSRHCIPENLPHMFLIDGGGLAVENALKVAFDWKVRKNIERGILREGDHEKEKYGTRVIHFKDAFHGRTGYTMSLTNTSDPRKYMYFAKFDWPRFPNPKITFPLNEKNLDSVKGAESQTVFLIENYLKMYPHSACAIIIEPVQSEGGDNHFRAEFFKELRRIADEHEVLLIFDEVQTGIGLTGKMWCYQNFGIQPDIVAFGKKTQVCGILASRRIDEVKGNCFQTKSRLNSSWGGNLIDMIRFTKILEIIEEENLIENAKFMGQKFLEGLEILAEDFSKFVFNVRGIGLLCAFDLPDGEKRDTYLNKLRKGGLMAFAAGDNSVRFRPKLDISAENIDEGLDILRKTLKEI